MLREGPDGTVESTFRFSGTEARPVGAEPVLPDRCRTLGPITAAELPDGGAVVRARFACGPRGLAGGTVSVRGLEGTGVQIAVRVERADGSSARALLDDGTRALALEDGASEDGVLARYVALGVEHIATGVDHLLFVLALLLLVRGRARLVATITAFTAGHSVTLALAALSLVVAPRAAVEACIALSVLVVAHELARERTDGPSLTERAPWLVAGGFRAPAWPRLRGRAQRRGAPFGRGRPRALRLQPRRGARPARLRGARARRRCARALRARGAAAARADGARHRRRGLVLPDRSPRRARRVICPDRPP
ncbi:MAG: HupE/UreJ family protein [Sandaracinaceae bacterium]|nr:HupE/UreJ family protein [Sandaracinaceae bacterium]